MQAIPIPSSIEIQLPSGTLSALCFGNPNHPPILALHGWLDSAASFNHLAPLFPNFYIVALDLPGHGLSSHRPKGAYFHIADYIADTIFVLEYLQWKKCGLLGHSLGAAIAILVAACIPESIQYLGLIDALGPFATIEPKLPACVKSAVFEYIHLSKKRIPQYATKEQAIKARLRASPMLLSSINTLISRGLKKTTAGYLWRNDPRLLLKPLIMITERQVEAFLKSVQAPTCLIRTSDGWPFEETLFQSRSSCIQNLIIKEIKGQHHVHLDNPKDVANIFLPFFTQYSMLL